MHQKGFNPGRARLDTPDCVCPRLPIQLLYVSRGYYEDSFSVLYSRNRFVLRCRNAEDLGVALKLNNHILSIIHKLMVRLNHWPCVRGHLQLNFARPSVCSNCSSPPNTNYALSSTSSEGRHQLAQWKRLLTHLASKIIAGQLKFTFIYDVADLISGQAVLGRYRCYPL
jgi:hypothetical protein